MSSAEVERGQRHPQFKMHHRMALALEVEGVSVQEMADYLDVNRNSVGRWINGHTRPNKQTLRLWAGNHTYGARRLLTHHVGQISGDVCAPCAASIRKVFPDEVTPL